MNNQPTYLTLEGKQKLDKEYNYLINVKRPQVSDRIREAKEEGDLRENAEYDDAKMEQGLVEMRIKELEHLLKRVEIITKTKGNVIHLGSTVTICEEGTEFEETYTLVGATEASPRDGRISNESPWGKALLRKTIGDWITVDTPGGEITFEVIDVQ
ncbi:MAG: transcription elongation factor GreA [Ardenticatenaceae bacterium]